MLIAVGSLNEAKIEGVRRGFRKIFHNMDISVVGISVKGLPPQPIGWRETLRGAVIRGLKAVETFEDSDYGVGVEAGLIPLYGTISGYMDTQICAIVDRDMKVSIGTCMLFEFPPIVVDAVISGRVEESETVFEEISGIERIGEGMGAIGLLSRGVVSRSDLTEQAVIAALIPRVRPDLYPRNKMPSAKALL